MGFLYENAKKMFNYDVENHCQIEMKPAVSVGKTGANSEDDGSATAQNTTAPSMSQE